MSRDLCAIGPIVNVASHTASRNEEHWTRETFRIGRDVDAQYFLLPLWYCIGRAGEIGRAFGQARLTSVTSIISPTSRIVGRGLGEFHVTATDQPIDDLSSETRTKEAHHD